MGIQSGQEYVDFIDELKGSYQRLQPTKVQYHYRNSIIDAGVVDLAVKILSFLDVSSLGNAEQVSKTWQKTIVEGNVWQTVVNQEVLLIVLSYFLRIVDKFPLCSCPRSQESQHLGKSIRD